MTGVDVEHTKALEAAATPGPWDVLRDGPSIEDSAVDYSIWCEAIGDRLTSEVGKADAEFIVHARTAVPALVAAVERVQALHTPLSVLLADASYCTGCGDPYPCPTIRALETP
ncbi:hypothetical protein [Rhodococcus sp. 3-2]|uniref:hypothetical protein n=1 Tax=Rhodococcus sp. 3-2 TaxID=2890836 RepID=UPI001D17EDA1|nr:hypothetical protein [Rhodococcus sp. 3-2]MCC4300406.1 hypothetical protein [Rhodococcus sp. 3-2]MCC4300466.1 hypothetical protein [Rhodococcus sp. 3-2]